MRTRSAGRLQARAVALYAAGDQYKYMCEKERERERETRAVRTLAIEFQQVRCGGNEWWWCLLFFPELAKQIADRLVLPRARRVVRVQRQTGRRPATTSAVPIRPVGAYAVGQRLGTDAIDLGRAQVVGCGQPAVVRARLGQQRGGR